MKEKFIVSFLILFFVFLNSLNFFVGLIKTPQNSVFLGTTHWSGDYFYYLSQFAQGKYSWVTSFDLFTNDFPSKTLVGWVNVFAGRLFYILGISHIWTYQICTALFTATFLGICFLLIREIYPSSRRKRLTAFFLFNFANAFPMIENSGGKIHLFHYDYWFNNGTVVSRLVGVPHQMLERSVLALSILLTIWFFRNRRNKIAILAGLILSGFILASIEPVHWLVTVIVLCISALLMVLFSKFANLSLFIPGFIFFLSGLPMIIYLKKLFVSVPYSQLTAWEASQQQNVGFLHFLLSNGPLVMLAILGFIFLDQKKTTARLIMVVFTILTVGLFFSPFPGMFSIVNVRFLPALTTLFFACLATAAIPKKGRSLSLVVIFILSIIPLILQMQRRLVFDTSNGFYYVPKTVIATFSEADKISTGRDTFLVIWPFNVSFPGITGRRVYEGHPLLTVDPGRKDQLQAQFFSGKMNRQDMEDFLLKNNIQFVISYSWMSDINDMSNLDKVYDSGYLAVYKLNRNRL